MPTTIRQLFHKFDIKNFHHVKWATKFDEINEGIYVVCTSNYPDRHLGTTNMPVFDDRQINLCISTSINFQVDGLPATLENIKNRLAEFWLPDESILYIGKAPKRLSGSGISRRVSEYFSTAIGNGGPHSGGQWIKTLKGINTFSVYYGVCQKSADIENKMLRFFMSNVSKDSLSILYDKNLPLPFANIKYTGNKKHGLQNQRL